MNKQSIAALVGACLAVPLFTGSTAFAARMPDSATTTLTVWSFQGTSTTPSSGVPYAFYLINRRFEQLYPNVKINMVLQDFSDYRQVFAAAATAHQGPDVWETLPGSYLYEYDAALLPLNKYITPSFFNSLNGWSGGIVPEWANSGTIYGFPSEVQSIIWYYNKSLFAKAGINEPPATWADFLTDCQKLKSAGVTPIAYGNDGGFDDNILAGMLAEMNPPSKLLGIGNGSVSWTSPAVTAAMTAIFNLAPYYESGFLGVTAVPGGSDLFAGGKAAMYSGIISNNQNYFQFQTSLGVKNLGEFRQPTMGAQYAKYAPAMTLTSDYMWTVTKWTKDTADAIAYAEFMESPYAEHILLVDGGDFPNLTTDVPTTQFNTNPSTKTIWHLLQTSKLVPQANSSNDTALSTYETQQTSDVWDNSESITAGLKAIQAYATQQPAE